MKLTAWLVIKKKQRQTAFKGDGAWILVVGGIQWERR